MCSVPQCSNYAGQGISLHLFPNDVALKKKWIHVSRIGKIVPKNASVCSDHFTREDFKVQQEGTFKRSLKPTAVPSLKLPKRFLDANKKTPEKLSLMKGAERVEKRRLFHDQSEQIGNEIATVEPVPSSSKHVPPEVDAHDLEAANILCSLANF